MANLLQGKKVEISVFLKLNNWLPCAGGKKELIFAKNINRRDFSGVFAKYVNIKELFAVSAILNGCGSRRYKSLTMFERKVYK